MVRCVLLCPGQGAQKVGMGRDLAERFPRARETFEAIDDALGLALSRLMWEGPDDELTLTHNAQPAILAHSLAVFAVVRDALAPAVGAGHSLGEYSAYAAAGSMTVGEAARLVRRRGELMLAAGRKRPGAMAAVLGLAAGVVADVCRECSTGDEVAVPANLNGPDQVVISGDPGAVERAGERLKARGAKRVLPLKVSGAFHSPLMEPAAREFRAELDRLGLADPAFPIVANAAAVAVSDAAEARRLLGEQLTAPVRWVECVQVASQLAGESTYVEVGPGTVLTGLLKRIVPEAGSLALGTAEQVTQFLESHGG